MPKKTNNLGVQFLERNKENLNDYEGCCGELVNGMIHWLGEDTVSILYVETRSGESLRTQYGNWSYHMAAVVNRVVHDPYFPDAIMSPRDYVANVFQNTSTKNIAWRIYK